MPDFLTIGGTAYDVIDGGAQEDEPEAIGTRFYRTFSGRPRSSARALYRKFTGTIGPLTQAQFTTLSAAVAGAFVHSLGGKWIESRSGAATIRAVLLLHGATPMDADFGAGVRFTVQFEARQVADTEPLG